MGDHVLGRRGVVVADVVDGARARPVDRGAQDPRDVLDVDAAEHLAGLHDPARRARADLGEGPAARAVDPRQSEDVQRQVRHRAPRRLGRHALRAAPRGGGEGRVLVHPTAAPVAVDARGGKVARPFEPRGRPGDGAAPIAQDGVAFLVGGDGAQQVRGGRDVLAQVIAREEARLDAFPAQGLGLGLRPGGADHAPPGQERQERAGRVAVAEGEQRRQSGAVRAAGPAGLHVAMLPSRGLQRRRTSVVGTHGVAVVFPRKILAALRVEDHRAVLPLLGVDVVLHEGRTHPRPLGSLLKRGLRGGEDE